MIVQLKRLFTQSLLVSALFYSFTAAAEHNNVEPLAGKWQIKRVCVNTQQTMRPSILMNDPTLVGRTLSFTANNITGEPLLNQGCEQPVLKAQPEITLNKLLASTIGAESSKDLSNNYSLELQGTDKVTPVFVQCGKGMLGPKGEATDNWLVKLDKKTILTNWDDNTLLALQKLPADAPAAPSFNCQKAVTATEKAICASFDLASWDHSVNDAWQMAVHQIKNTGVDVTAKLAALKSEQQRWLIERNACKGEQRCIKQQMVTRVTDLVESAK